MKIGIFIILFVLVFLLVLCIIFRKPSKENSQAALTTGVISSASNVEDSIININHPYLIKARQSEKALNYDSAIAHYQNGVTRFQKKGNWFGYVYTLNRIATIYISAQKYEEAFPILQLALHIGERKIRGTKFMSHVYFSFGQYYYYYQEDPKRALSLFNKSLEIRLKLPKTSALVARCYNYLGEVHRYLLYDYLTAENYYLQALEIQDKDLASDSVDVYYSYFNLATTNRLKGDLDKALFYAEKALEYAERLPYVEYAINCFNTLGNIRRDRNEYAPALNAYQQSIARCTASKDEIVQGEVYNNLVELYSKNKNYDSAFDCANKALKAFHKYELHEGMGETYFFLGDIFKQQKKYNQALSYYSKSLHYRVLFFGDWHREVSNTYQRMAEVYLEMDNADSALARLQLALISGSENLKAKVVNLFPPIKHIGNNYKLFESFNLIGLSYLKMFHQDPAKKNVLISALNSFKTCDSLIHLHFNSYDNIDAKLVILDKVNEVYENAIECAYLLYTVEDKKYAFDGIKFMENSKARILSNQLLEMEKVSQYKIPDSLRIAQNILNYEYALNKRKLESENDAGKVNDLNQLLFEINRKKEIFLNRLKSDFPHYYEARYENNDLHKSDINELVNKYDATVVEYFYGKDCIYVISYGKKSEVFERVELTKGLKDQIGTFTKNFGTTESIQSRQNFAGEVVTYMSTAHSIYQSIFASVKKSTNSGSQLNNYILVTDKELGFIPFEALVDSISSSKNISYKSLNYLINSCQINYAFSLNSLLRVFKNDKIIENGIAFSYFKKTAASISEFESLEQSEKEIDNLSAMLDIEVIKKSSATEHDFKNSSPDFDLIHLAIHGVGNADNLNGIKLIFNVGTDTTEDNMLYPYEVYALNLKAKLVVLSACETGRGKLLAGEGFYSMAQSFAYAGCQSILMSLSEIDDWSTREIISGFYHSLGSENSIAQSLRNAKLDYIIAANRFTAHPKYWSGLISVGDSLNVKIQSSNKYQFLVNWILILVILAALSLSVSSYQKIR